MILALITLSLTFFLCGFSTTLNDTLIPFLQGLLHLSYTQIMLVPVSFYGAYFVMSPLAGQVMARIGYRRNLALGTWIAAMACFSFYPAVQLRAYPCFLLSIFGVGTGVAFLQVSLNPYALLLGDQDRGQRQLTLVQAFNGLGMLTGPYAGSFVLTLAADSLFVPYLFLGSIFSTVALFVFFKKLPSPVVPEVREKLNLSQEPGLLLTIVGIFLYVGAEVCVGSFMVRYLAQEDILGCSLETGARLSTIYWSGLFFGRFAGFYLLRYVPQRIFLLIASLGASFLILIAIQSKGVTAATALLGVGMCNSAIFPLIFALGMETLTGGKEKAAGLLCMANLGGAGLPFIQGIVADSYGLNPSFVIPCLAYLAIVGLAILFPLFLVKKLDPAT